MKIVLSFLFLITITSCAELGQKLGYLEGNTVVGNLKDPRYTEQDFDGLTPVEVKKKIGDVPIYEIHRSEKLMMGGWQEEPFLLVYNTKPDQFRAVWNLDKQANCIIIPFSSKEDYKFKASKPGYTGSILIKGKNNFCGYQGFTDRGFKEITAEALMEKFNSRN